MKNIFAICSHTEKYTGTESDIQNDNLLYKIHQKFQNIFEYVGYYYLFILLICFVSFFFFHYFFFFLKSTIEKYNNKQNKLLCCILYKFHNSYFVKFVYFVICIYLVCYFLFIYPYTCSSFILVHV